MRSTNISSGSASATGPGRPLTAVWNARETNSGLAGQLAVSLGHIRGARFHTAGDELDLRARVIERIQHRQITLPRHAKRQIDAVNLQLIDKNLPTAPQTAHEAAPPSPQE